MANQGRTDRPFKPATGDKLGAGAFPPLSFEDSAIAAMGALRGALAELVGHVPGPVRRAVDLERALRLERKLAWQVFRLSRSSSLSDAANVPSPASMRRVLEAARQQRVPQELLDKVQAASEQFEELVAVHGGDRAGLISMIGGLAREPSEAFNLRVRRTAFRANAHLWGVLVRRRIRTYIYNGPPGAGRVDDIISLQAEVGLQRMRDGHPLSIAFVLKTSSDPFTEGHSVPSGVWRPGPGAPASAFAYPELLREFCSQPLPVMRPRPTELGGIETDLNFTATGRTGAVTLFASAFVEATGEGASGVYFGKHLVTIPAEELILDMLIPVGRSTPSTARAAIYGRRELVEHVYEIRPADLLPQPETFEHLGAATLPPGIAGAPAYVDAVDHVLTRHGWQGVKFDVYRCRVQYPVLHSMLFYRVDAAAQSDEQGRANTKDR